MTIISGQENYLPKPKYKYITNEQEARKALELLDRYPVVYVDTETTALDPFEAKLSLVQMGTGDDNNFVFDVRTDVLEDGVPVELLVPILTNKSILKVLQNAAYDMKILKVQTGHYIKNIYDTMLAEQLLHLGLGFTKASLDALVSRYLGLTMQKEPRGSFTDYTQRFQDFQLEYAANDVVVLPHIRACQLDKIHKEKLEEVAQLEFDFVKPLCEMELNGVSLINIDSNDQLKKSLKRYGLSVEDTKENTLKKHAGLPVIDAILDYRKYNKLTTTYGEALLNRINPYTGRLHTDFRQMVATGRLSSSNPNLQNIPHDQIYRSCFVAKEGYTLITSDQGSAELRIIGNLSEDPLFIEAFNSGKDVHTVAASMVFDVPYDKVTSDLRDACKSISFGLCYGMSSVGLADRLKITKKEADKLIDKYFSKFKKVKEYLDRSGSDAVMNRYSTTISGRKRYYSMPPYDHPDRKSIQGSIERRGKNAPIQGSDADTIKKAMILLCDRLSGHDAKLILTVHDEIVVECRNDQVEEVSAIVGGAVVDGFNTYFSLIPMETDVLTGPCWLKGSCKAKSNGKNKCGCSEMKFVPDDKYGTKSVCAKCGTGQT